MHDSDIEQEFFDALHLAMLELPKRLWKFCVLNNSSDDAHCEQRAAGGRSGNTNLIAGARTTNQPRSRAKVAHWRALRSTSCAEEHGSLGAPIVIVTIVMGIARDLQAQGALPGASVTAAAAAAEGVEATTTGRGRGGRREGMLLVVGAAAVAGAAARSSRRKWLRALPPDADLSDDEDGDRLSMCRQLRSDVLIRPILPPFGNAWLARAEIDQHPAGFRLVLQLVLPL
eukprot:2706904-Pleurochrysis_carterae.AAC.1